MDAFSWAKSERAAIQGIAKGIKAPVEIGCAMAIALVALALVASLLAVVGMALSF